MVHEAKAVNRDRDNQSRCVKIGKQTVRARGLLTLGDLTWGEIWCLRVLEFVLE